AAAQPDGSYAVYAADGTRTDLGAVVDAMARADVVFLGERHNDPTAHALQRRLLEEAHRRYGAERPVALGLEMFERDVQLVLDEYLAGLVREQDFLAAARPWGTYAEDYRPLVEYAKAHGLAVIAANAPARYVSRVGREGLSGLDALPEPARAFLPPRPVAPPSDALAARFEEEMAEMAAVHGSSPDGLLAAQNLRDATMAFSLAEHLARHPGALVVHLNGAFHSRDGLGIPEHLVRYAPGVRPLVVTLRPSDDLDGAPAPGDGAFVILTDRTALIGR
ncbi:MAG: ChaN family lipoprotein, partial [Rubricoccaceae bacterium]|nr:ChaN family lipoprotein [Rubricoccaceae bacterium]